MLGTFFSRNRRAVSAKPDPSGQKQEQFKYCPSCGDEFRVEFEYCAACDEPLVASTMHDGSKPGEISDRQDTELSPEALTAADKLISARQGTLMEMKRVSRLLAKLGIASLIAGDAAECTKGCCGGSSSFLLQIKEDDRVRAGTILAEDFKRLTALDSHQQHVPSAIVIDETVTEISCPACGFNVSEHEQCCPECGLCF